MKKKSSEASSFRDPAGFLFYQDGQIYRQINRTGQTDFEHFISSGLYNKLVENKLIIEHQESENVPPTEEGYKVIAPKMIPFISYPYEWCFSQLKDAALVTLKIQKLALKHQMSLKDASAFNIQFVEGKPVFIDTLSFEVLKEGKPWVAYRQFCQHFLGPLALSALVDTRLNQLWRVFIDGIPVDLASRLLPKTSRLNLGLLAHLHLHASSQKRYEAKKIQAHRAKISRSALLAIIDSLESTVKKLKWQPAGTEWADYYDNTNYSASSIEKKKQIVSEMIREVKPQTVWDLGANDGTFSRLASERKIFTVAFDIDPSAVEKNYRRTRAVGDPFILPLVLDLTNPSAGTGWQNKERRSLTDRGPADCLLALALIHHLAISNNLPFDKIAEYFASIGHYLIIEFVPKDDSQVQLLLATREDIFSHYTEADFQTSFAKYFKIIKKQNVAGSKRTLYLMRRF